MLPPRTMCSCVPEPTVSDRRRRRGVAEAEVHAVVQHLRDDRGSVPCVVDAAVHTPLVPVRARTHWPCGRLGGGYVRVCG